MPPSLARSTRNRGSPEQAVSGGNRASCRAPRRMRDRTRWSEKIGRAFQAVSRRRARRPGGRDRPWQSPERYGLPPWALEWTNIASCCRTPTWETFKRPSRFRTVHSSVLGGKRHDPHAAWHEVFHFGRVPGLADEGQLAVDLFEQPLALLLQLALLHRIVPVRPSGDHCGQDLIGDLRNAPHAAIDVLLHRGTRHELQQEAVVHLHPPERPLDLVAKRDLVAIVQPDLFVEQPKRSGNVRPAFVEGLLGRCHGADIDNKVLVQFLAIFRAGLISRDVCKRRDGSACRDPRCCWS